jgi:hypothetical protein
MALGTFRFLFPEDDSFELVATFGAEIFKYRHGC